MLEWSVIWDRTYDPDERAILPNFCAGSAVELGIAPIAHVQLKRAFFTHLRSSRSFGEMTA